MKEFNLFLDKAEVIIIVVHRIHEQRRYYEGLHFLLI
jgi:hypothetical protein